MNRHEWPKGGELTLAGVYVSLSTGILPYGGVDGFMLIKASENFVGDVTVRVDCASRLDVVQG